MIHLRPVISVREIPPNASKMRASLPSIRDLISASPNEEEERILGYLRQGLFGSWYPDPGLEYDVLQTRAKIDFALISGSPSLHPHSLLTDGEWLWPSVLLHYVSKYHLALEPAFVKHARSNQWRIQRDTIKMNDLCWSAFEGQQVLSA